MMGLLLWTLELYSRPKTVKDASQKSIELKCPPLLPLSSFTHNLGHQNLTKPLSNYQSFKTYRKRNRKSSIESSELWDMKPTHNFLQVTNNLLPNYNVAQSCLTQTQRFEGGGRDRIPLTDLRTSI